MANSDRHEKTCYLAIKYNLLLATAGLSFMYSVCDVWPLFYEKINFFERSWNFSLQIHLVVFRQEVVVLQDIYLLVLKLWIY